MPRVARVLYGLLALAMAALGASTFVYTVLIVYRLHVVLPFADEWMMTSDIQRVLDKSYSLWSLADQYNEHRLLVPRFFFFIDDFVFAGSNRFDIAVAFAFQAVNAGVLIACVRGQVASLASRAILTGLVVLALFSLRQADNFTIGFQLQFTGVFAFANLAIPPFLSGLRRLRAGDPVSGAWRRIGSAYALCALATYTMANGALAAPTLFVLSLLLAAPKRLSLATAAVSAVLAALYFHGLREMGLGLSAAAAMDDPLAYPRFVSALLGDVVGIVGVDLTIPHVEDPYVAAELFGSVGLAAMAGAAWVVARGRARTRGAPILLGIMGFTTASACATAYGRVGVGMIQAFELRYVEVSVIFWSAAVLFWAPYAGRNLGRPASLAARAALAATIAALVASLGVAEVRQPHTLIAQAVASRTLRDSLLSGFIDPEAIRYEIWSADVLAGPVAVLRAAHLSLFAGPEAGERGDPVDAVGAVAPDAACTGSASAEADPALGPGGVRMTGTAWDAGRDAPVARILTVGPDGRVSGFGSLDKPVGRPLRWTGYATGAPGTSVSAYAVLADGRLCRLAAAGVQGR